MTIRESDYWLNLYRRTLETDLFGVVHPRNTGDNENSGGTNHGTNGPISGTNGTNPAAAAGMECLIALIRTNENITQKELVKETGFSLRTVKTLENHTVEES